MAEYKVCYSGFAYVKADSEEEAEEIFWDGGSYSEEYRVDEVVEL